MCDQVGAPSSRSYVELFPRTGPDEPSPSGANELRRKDANRAAPQNVEVIDLTYLPDFIEEPTRMKRQHIYNANRPRQRHPNNEELPAAGEHGTADVNGKPPLAVEVIDLTNLEDADGGPTPAKRFHLHDGTGLPAGVFPYAPPLEPGPAPPPRKSPTKRPVVHVRRPPSPPAPVAVALPAQHILHVEEHEPDGAPLHPPQCAHAPTRQPTIPQPDRNPNVALPQATVQVRQTLQPWYTKLPLNVPANKVAVATDINMNELNQYNPVLERGEQWELQNQPPKPEPMPKNPEKARPAPANVREVVNKNRQLYVQRKHKLLQEKAMQLRNEIEKNINAQAMTVVDAHHLNMKKFNQIHPHIALPILFPAQDRWKPLEPNAPLNLMPQNLEMAMPAKARAVVYKRDEISLKRKHQIIREKILQLENEIERNISAQAKKVVDAPHLNMNEDNLLPRIPNSPKPQNPEIARVLVNGDRQPALGLNTTMARLKKGAHHTITGAMLTEGGVVNAPRAVDFPQNCEVPSLGAGDEQALSSHYEQMLELEAKPLIPNTEVFTCGICLSECAPGDGVLLHECLHAFCRDCLAELVRHCDDEHVGCPHRDDFACPARLLDREERALVSPAELEARLARGVRLAAARMADAFHCRTADCAGWCVHDVDVAVFDCPLCGARNCLRCQAIHTGETCKRHSARAQLAADLQGAGAEDRRAIEELVRRGAAMRCPTCRVLIMKAVGCDWIQCTICKTEICWARRMARWGPGGRGDVSGGCRCRVNLAVCHPECRGCH